MNKLFKVIFFLLIISFFTACSNKNIEIQDLKTYSQNPKEYLKINHLHLKIKAFIIKSFIKTIF